MPIPSAPANSSTVLNRSGSKPVCAGRSRGLPDKWMKSAHPSMPIEQKPWSWLRHCLTPMPQCAIPWLCWINFMTILRNCLPCLPGQVRSTSLGQKKSARRALSERASNWQKPYQSCLPLPQTQTTQQKKSHWKKSRAIVSGQEKPSLSLLPLAARLLRRRKN